LPFAALGLAAGVDTDLPVPAAAERTLPALPPAPAESVALAAPEAVPIVAPDPPRPALEIFRSLALGDPAMALEMFNAAWATLRVTPDAADAVNSVGVALLYQDRAGDEGFGDKPFESAEFRDWLDEAMTDLRRTNENAVALNDLGIALFALGQASRVGQEPPAPSGEQFNGSNRLSAAAIRLLEASVGTFPGQHELRINLAFLRSVVGGDSLDPGLAQSGLDAYLADHPSDLTARLSLASLQARRWDRDGLDDAFGTLDALGRGDPASEALAHVARGDALVASVDRIHDESPELARVRASRAVDEYDAALALTRDAQAFAGRAVALDLLGERRAAVEAQAAAVAAAPESVVHRLRLAMLDGCAGDQQGRRREAQAVIELVVPPGRPLLGDVRIVAPEPLEADNLGVDRGFGGIALGSARLPRTFYREPSGAGGGYVIDAAAFLARPPCLGEDGEDLAEIAGRQVLAASIALADPDTAARDARAWLDAWGIDDEDRPTWPDEMTDAARIAAGREVAPEARVDAILLAATELPPEQSAPLCRTALEAAQRAEELGGQRTELIGCVIDGAARSGNQALADWGIDRIDASLLNWAGGSIVLEAGDVRREAGRGDEADRLYRLSAQDQATFVPAMLRLGDRALDEQDARSAFAYYELARTALEAGGSLQDADKSRDLRRLAQLVQNNGGIARLMLAPRDSADVPDCAAAGELCRDAEAGFAAAAASDGANWTYWWNLGWVARLEGDPSAAESHLRRALVLKPDLVPVLNDLGVLEARRGADDLAEAHLRQAVALEPGYDLAAWNLGVLESGRGAGGLVAGQAWFARAITANPELRLRNLNFLTDERVYRVAVQPDRELGIDTARAPAAGAAAFAAVAALGGIAQLLGALQEPAQEAAGVAVQSGLAARRGGLGARLRSRLPTIGRNRVSLVWVPILAVLAITTSWNALATAADAPLAGLLVTVVAVLAGIVCHALGHVAAAAGKGTIRPAAWWPGIVIGLLALPLQVAAGPYPTEQLEGLEGRRFWLIALAGPVANLAAAVVAYLAFTVVPLPFLRLVAQVQLAIAAYSLMPLEPLDGSRLEEHQPVVVAGLGLAIAAVSTALVLGIA
jgi:tetratricopeptide (TPR) repeat protein